MSDRGVQQDAPPSPAGQGLRVLQLTDFYPPVLGGLESVVRDLSAGLAEQGVEVAVATLTPEPDQTPGVSVHSLRSFTGRVPGLHQDAARPFHPPFPEPAVRAGLARLVEEFRPDVVHAHSWLLHSWTGLRARFPQVRTIAYAHDYGLFCVKKTNQHRDELGPCDRPGLRRCTACASAQYGLGKAAVATAGLLASQRATAGVDALVAVSSAVAATHSRVLRAGLPTVIPPALRVPPTTALPRPGFLPDGPFALYVGQLSPHKGLDVLLEALPHLSLPLVLLGMPKPGWQSPEDPRVVVRTDVPRDVVLAAWREATVGVVPSLWADPMPLAALEAMSQGCPVVASGVGGLLDSVVDGVTGTLVPPGRAEVLAEAVRRIAQDAEVRRRMSDAALCRSSSFSLEVVVSRWIDLYRQVCTGRVVGSPE